MTKKKNELDDFIKNNEFEEFDIPDDNIPLDPPDPSKYEPEEIKIDEPIDDIDNVEKLFTKENKVYENSIKDYHECRIRIKQSLFNLETIMNKLKEQILLTIDTPYKLFETYSSLMNTYNTLCSSFDKNNKEMMKITVENFKCKIELLAKYTEEKFGKNEEDGSSRKFNLKDVLSEVKTIEKNVEITNKDKGLF